jgi:DNA polymerase-3 subunit alpha
LTFFDEFTKGKNKYKSSLSEKSKTSRILELRKFWDTLSDDKLSIREQVRAEIKILGRIQSSFPNTNKRYAFVIGVNTKFSPRLQLFSLASGTMIEVKIQKRLFEPNPIEEGMIIYCSSFEKKAAVKYVDGQFQEDLSKPPVWWVTSYRIVTENI